VFLALNNIRSAWNIGAIFRTADAIGAQVILVGYTPRPVGKTFKLIKKTARGAEQAVNWFEFTHSQETFQEFPPDKFRHLGIEISHTSDLLWNFLKSPQFPQKPLDQTICWFGNEVHGLPEEILENCEKELHLPMQGYKNSLNIASTVCTVGYLLNYQQFLSNSCQN
jgi:tRNA G18 (ribose-2'-O)-methylase SpoU